AYLNEQLLLDALYIAVRGIRWQIEDYQMDVAAITALQKRIESAAPDVASLAALRQHELELHESAAATHLSILRDYIKLLNMAGVLQQRRNWLRSQMI
ncbi:MAG: hypothetical protein KJO82_00680, partial [Gammaproteobacteria bacterium]|nr:hypothetical protein [Gammaproteobacteria bacterium]